MRTSDPIYNPPQWLAQITKAQARLCSQCGKPLWRIDPWRRKNDEGHPLGYEPRHRNGPSCWNGKACTKRLQARIDSQ